MTGSEGDLDAVGVGPDRSMRRDKAGKTSISVSVALCHWWSAF